MRPPRLSGEEPKANAKPTKYQQTAAIEKFVRTFATTVPAFFCRENPISRNMKPHCMNITTMPATITHMRVDADGGQADGLLDAAAAVDRRVHDVGRDEARQHERDQQPRADAGSTFSAIVRLICPPRLDTPSSLVMVGPGAG